MEYCACVKLSRTCAPIVAKNGADFFFVHRSLLLNSFVYSKVTGTSFLMLQSLFLYVCTQQLRAKVTTPKSCRGEDEASSGHLYAGKRLLCAEQVMRE